MDNRELQKFADDLKKFRMVAYAHATKGALNKAAFKGREIAQKIVERRMVLRTKGRGSAKGSILVEPVRTLRIKDQRAFLGTTADYMETAEFGGMKRARGKHGLALPTTFASREGRSVRPRRRMPSLANAMKNIRLRQGARGAMGRKQRTVLSIQQAKASGARYVYLELQRTKGIFKVSGTKKRPRIDMVASLSHKSLTIPATPWLRPTIERLGPLMPGILKSELQKQLVRHRLFKQ